MKALCLAILSNKVDFSSLLSNRIEGFPKGTEVLTAQAMRLGQILYFCMINGGKMTSE